MASAKQIAWRKKFAKLYGKKKKGSKKKGSKTVFMMKQVRDPYSNNPNKMINIPSSKSTKTTGKKKETRWTLAKQKFKGDRRGLNKYYHSIPSSLRKKYGMPQKAPNVDTRKEREMSRDRMNQGKCIKCGRQSGSLRDGYCAMCD